MTDVYLRPASPDANADVRLRDPSATDSGGLVLAALAASDTTDVVAFSGAVRVAGALASTEAADALAVSAKVRVAAAFAVSEAVDIAALAAGVRIGAAFSLTDAPDAAAVSAAVRVAGALAATDAADVLAGAVTAVPLAGDYECWLEATDQADVASFDTGAQQAQQPSGGGVAQRTSRLPDFGPRQLPLRRLRAVAGRLDVSERADRARVYGEIDWSGDDEEMLLMSDAA